MTDFLFFKKRKHQIESIPSFPVLFCLLKRSAICIAETKYDGIISSENNNNTTFAMVANRPA
jgi:hypothetical protein